MRLRFLGMGGSGRTNCPTLYATDRNSYIVQGWETGTVGTVEIPHMLLGFLEPKTFLAATLLDTGRGTFTITGRPVTDPETLAKLTFDQNETAIEVPSKERTWFGGV
ncbi:MAG: hypothetical protein J2P17_31525 [Mycobacterium sp.]|nr:hypothetical protein [Mycobacterium sp.]